MREFIIKLLNEGKRHNKAEYQLERFGFESIGPLRFDWEEIVLDMVGIPPESGDWNEETGIFTGDVFCRDYYWDVFYNFHRSDISASDVYKQLVDSLDEIKSDPTLSWCFHRDAKA